MGRNWLFKFVPVFIVAVFVAIVIYYIALAAIGVFVVKQVNDNGLKSIVERIWNGKRNVAINYGAKPIAARMILQVAAREERDEKEN